jgi:ribose 1,5-bisphosphokinase PhnN
MIQSIVLIGPHGAGKSTLGRALSARLRWTFDDEIGARLRAQAQSLDPRAHALLEQIAFDAEVERAEIERDRTARGPRVIETWHPGNAAYAIARNGAGFSEDRAMRAATEARDVLVVPLVISERCARERLSEYGAPEHEMVRFFLRVGELAETLSRAWGLRTAPALHTDECAVDSLVDHITSLVHRG